nr:odorant receptor [Semanotus bifasciatus]
MKIFPKNEHLKLTMRANALLGVWPFIFENNPKLRNIYAIYSRGTFIYYLLFIISAIIKLFILICDEVLVIKEIVANLCITLLYSVTIMRVYAIKTPRVKGIIREILVLEQRILRSEDDKIIAIYNSHASQSKISNAIFLVNIFLVTALYFIHPLYVDDLVKYYPSKNLTVIERPLPLSSWFPFDAQKYYLQSYLWHMLDGSIGASFVTYTDIFSFSLIIFPLGQIKILIHILSNFEEYAEKVKHQLRCSSEEASFVTLRECILKHKEIIRYINEFNTAMRNIMVLDFLQSSLQLASIVLQLLVAEINLSNFIYSGQFAFSMFIRLLVYYWYANEIMVQSSDVGYALCASKWYEQPEKIKKMLITMLMRCNRLLCLEIGPFSTMTLGTFLGILKATYSYMMVIYK